MKAILDFLSKLFSETNGTGNTKAEPKVAAKDGVEPIPVDRMHEVPDFGEDQAKRLIQAARMYPKNVDLRIKWLQAVGKMQDNNIHWVMKEVRSATDIGKERGIVRFDKWSANNVAA